MSEQKINKSDYTDRKGVVHSSIGENIRSDNNGLFIDNFLDSYYELSADERLNFPFFPFKKGKWDKTTVSIYVDSSGKKYYKSDSKYKPSGEVYADNIKIESGKFAILIEASSRKVVIVSQAMYNEYDRQILVVNLPSAENFSANVTFKLMIFIED